MQPPYHPILDRVWPFRRIRQLERHVVFLSAANQTQAKALLQFHWRPIGTAPNYESIYLWDATSEKAYLCRREDPWGTWMVEAPFTILSDEDRPHDHNFTHWMPKPEGLLHGVPIPPPPQEA